MSSRTLKEKQTERSRKRRERETRDAIAKLKARPDSAVVNGFPVSPVLHQIVRDENGIFWKRNRDNDDWEQLSGGLTIITGLTKNDLGVHSKPTFGLLITSGDNRLMFWDNDAVSTNDWYDVNSYGKGAI